MSDSPLISNVMTLRSLSTNLSAQRQSTHANIDTHATPTATPARVLFVVVRSVSLPSPGTPATITRPGAEVCPLGAVRRPKDDCPGGSELGDGRVLAIGLAAQQG